MNADILAIGPHPDDADIGVGGILAKAAAAGKRVVIADLTRGELGTRGTPDERAAEAQAAARILGAAARENLGLPDGAVANTETQRTAVAALIRRHRPRILLAPMANDRHPDHEAAHALVRDAAYLAGLAKFAAEGDPWRPSRIYYYRVYGDPEPPAILIDVSAVFATKLAALREFTSQLYNPSYEGAETFVASKAFWEGIARRAAHWGAQIGVAHAEPLTALAPIAMQWPPGLEGEL